MNILISAVNIHCAVFAVPEKVKKQHDIFHNRLGIMVRFTVKIAALKENGSAGTGYVYL